MPTEEAIQRNWQEQKRRRDRYLKKHPDAVAGRINWFWKSDRQLQRLATLDWRNFCVDFAIPAPDHQLMCLLEKWNGSSGRITVDKIFERIEALGGVVFYWI